MAQEIEIEFKNVLTEQQYNNLLQQFDVSEQQIQTLRNDYFDTPTQAVKQANSALRIRQTDNYIECTLKQKGAAHSHLETTDRISAEDADKMRAGTAFLAPSVKEQLVQLQIPITELENFGSLTTKRVEIAYEGGLLVFDHTFYLQQEDYEVEYEAVNEALGKKIFDEFLQKYAISRQIADNKIARFAKALQQQKG